MSSNQVPVNSNQKQKLSSNEPNILAFDYELTVFKALAKGF